MREQVDRLHAALLRQTVAHGWLLAAAFLLLAPFKTMYEGPMALMALLGLLLVSLKPADAGRLPGVKWLFWLFMLIWLPMVLSLTDAVAHGRALSNTLTHLRFLFAGIFICAAMTESRARTLLLVATGVMLAFWSVDGTIQANFGKNLLGNPMAGNRVTGVYFPRLTMGNVLASISPLLFFWLGRMAGRNAWWLLLTAPLALTIILSGSRVAWIMIALSVCLMAGYALAYGTRGQLGKMLPVMLVSMALVGADLAYLPYFKQRLASTQGLLSTDAKQFDRATALRGTIWTVAGKVYADHWINGVGPRGFRYIYLQYGRACTPGVVYPLWTDPPCDKTINWKTNAPITHPHQLTLEIATETGTIGLLGYLAFLGLFIGRVVVAGRESLRTAWPWAVAAFISFFPLNAGHAFYGGKWACLVWWLLALAVAHLCAASVSAGASDKAAD